MYNNRNNPYLNPSTSPHVVGLNGNEISLLHHHGHHLDFLQGPHYLTTGATNASVLEASSAFFNDITGLNGRPDPCNMSVYPRKQTGTAKKDRHSKINTAQGPRDRRVRLSIGIARKFFDLQEMLGFDKPSKTLEWLLTKSKTAIKDLVQMKSCKSTNSTSGGPNSDCHDQEVESSCPSNSKGKSVIANNNSSYNKAKESRAKARARARERTKEKMCIKQQQQLINEASGYIKSNFHNQFEVSGSRMPNIHCPLSYEEATRELIQEESIVIKRRMKQLNPQIFGMHQQNPNTSSNVNENWDFSAILDHHNRFIN